MRSQLFNSIDSSKASRALGLPEHALHSWRNQGLLTRRDDDTDFDVVVRAAVTAELTFGGWHIRSAVRVADFVVAWRQQRLPERPAPSVGYLLANAERCEIVMDQGARCAEVLRELATTEGRLTLTIVPLNILLARCIALHDALVAGVAPVPEALH